MIEKKIKTREEVAKICEELRSQGKAIGFTSGVFDIMHAGHVSYLEDAKQKVDVMIVALNSDVSVKKYKGENRPIVPEKYRLRVMAALESIDYVFTFDERRNKDNIEALKPSFYIKAGDYDLSKLTSLPLVQQHGGDAMLIPIVHNTSTTDIVKKITQVYGMGAGEQVVTENDATHIALTKGKQERAIFLDRDGTINKEVEYLHEPEKFEFTPDALEGMKKFQDMGFKLVVITTQAGIGLGYFTKEDFYKVNRKMLRDASVAGIKLDRIYFCPHGFNDGCDCRKPNTALVERAQKDLNLDVKGSYFIGDKSSDIECGKRSGMRTIKMTTGHNEEAKVQPDFVASTLLEAANFVLEQERKL